MRTVAIIIVMIFSTCMLNCRSSKQENGLPTCIQTKIEVLKSQPVHNPPAEVWKWADEKETYYYFTSDCCDQFNFLFDSNCNVMCAPDGGFTGKGDGKCPQFTDNIKKTLIWKDTRK